MPQNTLNRLGVRLDLSSRGKEWLLNSALRVDDDVAEALYSHNRMVPTYTKAQITPIKNNYNGATPDSGYISGWGLTLEGLASGLSVRLDIRTLMNRFSVHDQITRFVCVEGWSAIMCLPYVVVRSGVDNSGREAVKSPKDGSLPDSEELGNMVSI